MKISTRKESIVQAVLLSERVTGKKESLPILSCILIDAQENVVVRATNLESGVDVRVPAEIEEKGRVAVMASVLSQTLRSINSDTVTLKTNDDGNLVIESRGTKTVIKAIPHDEFPTLSRDTGEKKGVTVLRDRFLRGLQAVIYAASPSMIRPELGSVYVSIKQGVIVCAATDSFRLAEKTIPGGSREEVGDILIPLKHALELVHILERLNTENIEVLVEETDLDVRSDSTRFISRVVDGTFPNYKEIIPKKFTTEATLLKSDLSEMLRKARIFSGNDQHVGLHVYPGRKIFSATARSNDVGEMSDSIDAAIQGEDIDINFHIGYLGECLSSIESDSITLGFGGIGRPMVVRGVSDATFTYLVMPLNR
ncbi:DNA polymerase III subunit beta [Candidatus Kaiserbacteria bacterium]|nr:DNA polymerase III subunit beta [Candidatus Kaiserbacteria bacterium]